MVLAITIKEIRVCGIFLTVSFAILTAEGVEKEAYGRVTIHDSRSLIRHAERGNGLHCRALQHTGADLPPAGTCTLWQRERPLGSCYSSRITVTSISRQGAPRGVRPGTGWMGETRH